MATHKYCAQILNVHQSHNDSDDYNEKCIEIRLQDHQTYESLLVMSS